MTLENSSVDFPYTTCSVCHKQIQVTNSYLRCKECKCAVHRRCRGDVSTSCAGIELQELLKATVDDDDVVPTAPAAPETEAVAPTSSSSNASVDIVLNKNYFGDLIFRSSELSPPIQIHCVQQIMDDIVLLGAESGLYSFHQQTKQLVHIAGIGCVNYIALNANMAKCILVGDQGRHLFLVDLRHLQSRAQASAHLKPKLDYTTLELPFANRVSTERWHYVVMNGVGACGGGVNGASTKGSDAHIIACTSSRIVILRFDIGQNRVKPVCALDTAKPVTCILFTAHSAIVASDKFFEIDLQTLQAEELLDESDMSSIEARTACHPMALFKINSQEFLLCFEEFGIFVDTYGDRSRPDNVNWANPPTGFIYRDPLLFVSYRNMIEVVRINKSYTNEQKQRRQLDMMMDDEVAATNETRSFITLNSPKLMSDSGQLGVFVLTKALGSGGGECGVELVAIDGVKSLKSFMSNSLETLLSSRLAGSSETISTINQFSSASDSS